MSLKRNYDELTRATDEKDSEDHKIFISSTIEDRASTFIAIYSPTLAPNTLQAHPPFRKASHRILAWRLPSKQQTLKRPSAQPSASEFVYESGHDDDGEKYAGKPLEKLMVEMNVTGAVVVARWYGGILLGRARFDHIVNVARDAIDKSLIGDAQSEPPSEKKIKLETSPEMTPEQEAEKKNRLAKQLVDRDNSIRVLRDLLAEKKAAKSGESGTPASETTKSLQDAQENAPITPDYQNMPLAKLKQLEKARDTTISWILKQIDQIEADDKRGSKSSPG